MEERAIVFLVVDDDAPMARAWARMLRTHQVSVAVAGTVQAARGVIDGDVVISGAIVDYRLPDGTGLEVIDRLRARWPIIPIALVTGDPPQRHFEHVALRRGVMYAQKPFSPAALSGLVERAVLIATAQQRGPSIDDLLAPYALSAALRDTLVAQLSVDTHEGAAALRGRKPSTIKSQTAAALHACGHDSLRGLTRDLLRRLGLRGLGPRSD